MHIYFLQHSSLFAPGRLADWLQGMGHSHNRCRLDEGELPPPWDHFDGLILLDALGPLDPQLLKRERKLLDRALKSGKPVLGIGFGAALIAEALGSIVSPAVEPERGWRTLTLDPASPLDLPETFETLLWHGDIFGLPDDALPLGRTAAGPVQGFVWDRGRVIAMQCHLELTANDAQALCAQEGTTADCGDLLADPRRFDRQAALLDRLMSQWLD
ncbi:type 1 glutamine amidotransferase [Salinicola sp. DM10]|uniref:type 1 glutamine amidotransferase n=1 Tax=Salinicola sp. DM10 TaxID=2815721 RepID=UPI001A90B6FB|nr:type 1 glutamine amidotransferase [Salinicola sp. DM10]MCE3028616.1 type 1 glutamine amidotransferase [Salinicola sp. DM10]